MSIILFFKTILCLSELKHIHDIMLLLLGLEEKKIILNSLTSYFSQKERMPTHRVRMEIL